MIDRLTRDGFYWLIGGMALALQWRWISLHFLPEPDTWERAWLAWGIAAGFIFCAIYGHDLAQRIRRSRRQLEATEYPPMEM